MSRFLPRITDQKFTSLLFLFEILFDLLRRRWSWRMEISSNQIILYLTSFLSRIKIFSRKCFFFFFLFDIEIITYFRFFVAIENILMFLFSIKIINIEINLHRSEQLSKFLSSFRSKKLFGKRANKKSRIFEKKKMQFLMKHDKLIVARR